MIIHVIIIIIITIIIIVIEGNYEAIAVLG